MNSLALELIDDIIGHVDEKDYDIARNYQLEKEDRSHLLACSLVCRLWLPLSQRRLFHRILFPEWGNDRIYAQIQRLDHVVLNSPHLATYIRVLELPGMCYLRSKGSEIRNPARMAIKPLSSLLRKVTQVQKLKMADLAWDVLPGDFRQSLCRVLELPSMACVSISGAQFACMDDFTNFINHARGLIGLSLGDIYTPWVSQQSFKVETKQAEDNKDKFGRHRISHLTRLDMTCVGDNSALVNWLLGPRSHLDVSHIHTLHIYLHKTEDDSVNRLLCTIGGSLKHVCILVPFELPMVNMAFNVNIEILGLGCTDMRSDTLSTLRSVLSTIDASNHIHHMALRVDPGCGTRVDWAAWEEVYSVLAGPRFQSLRMLSIIVYGTSYSDPAVENSRDMVAAYPVLATRGVRVSFCPKISTQCLFSSDSFWH